MTKKELEEVMDYLNKGNRVSALMGAEIAENGDKYIGTDTFSWISGLEEAILYSEKLVAAIAKNICEEEEKDINLHLIKDRSELKILNGCTIENILEVSDQEERQGALLTFKKELEAGGYKYIDLSLSGDGNQYMSEEY